MTATHPVPDGWAIPEGYEPTSGMPASCRSCRAPILWCRTPAGKSAPMQPDGVNHFATCPQASQWRRR